MFFAQNPGIVGAKIIELKNEEIHTKASESIREHGWLPGLFCGIIHKAKELLKSPIRAAELPPKPVLNIDLAEFHTMQKLMIKVQDKAREIRSLQEEVPKLKEQLGATKGIFKGKECKALEAQIQQTEQRIHPKNRAFGNACANYRLRASRNPTDENSLTEWGNLDTKNRRYGISHKRRLAYL